MLNNIFFHEASDLLLETNVLSEELKRIDFVTIGLEPGITFANKNSSSITEVTNAPEEELETIRSDCDP